MKTKLISGLSILALLLAACSSNGSPKRIAEYRSGDPLSSIGSAPIPELRLVYYAFLVLEVASLDRAAAKAEASAYELGGYLVRSDAWNREGSKQVTLVFAVPMPNFEAFRDLLSNLGKLQTERVWGEWVRSGAGNRSNYAEVTVQLQARGIDWPALPIRGWDPGRTFERAWEVFLAVFGFLVDILIWIGVVLGPFVLLAWLGWRLGLRWRSKS